MRRLAAGKYEADCNGTPAIIWQRTERGYNPVTGRERDMRFWGYTIGEGSDAYVADGYATKQEAWVSAYRYCERERAERLADAARERRREERRAASAAKGKH